MIILKEGNVPEFVHSFLSADGGFWVADEPFLNQVETELDIAEKRKFTFRAIGTRPTRRKRGTTSKFFFYSFSFT